MVEDVVTVEKDVPVKTCIDLLFKRHVGSIVIVDEARHCMGIFTERDAIRVVAQNVPLAAPIEKTMTKNVLTVNEDAKFEEARSIISSYQIRHLPVVDAEGKLVGLISVRHILDEFCGL
jgi:CBS domain-containing protein